MGQGEVDGSMEQSEMLPSINTTRLMHEQGEEYQLLVHNGDISYARWGYMVWLCVVPSDLRHADMEWIMLRCRQLLWQAYNASAN